MCVVLDLESMCTLRVLCSKESSKMLNSRFKNSGFVTNLWLTKFDGLILL